MVKYSAQGRPKRMRDQDRDQSNADYGSKHRWENIIRTSRLTIYRGELGSAEVRKCVNAAVLKAEDIGNCRGYEFSEGKDQCIFVRGFRTLDRKTWGRRRREIISTDGKLSYNLGKRKDDEDDSPSGSHWSRRASIGWGASGPTASPMGSSSSSPSASTNSGSNPRQRPTMISPCQDEIASSPPSSAIDQSSGSEGSLDLWLSDPGATLSVSVM